MLSSRPPSTKPAASIFPICAAGRRSPPAAQAADYFVRRQADLLGINDLILESLEADGAEAAATLRNGDTRFHVRVRGTDADPPRAVSCREDKLERPVVWSLVALEGEPAV